MQHTFSGLGVAVITPFKADDSVDEHALKKIIKHLIDGGVDYLVALGTTGESATLTKDEKRLIIDLFLEECLDKIPLVIGLGGNNTKAIVNQIKVIERLDYIQCTQPHCQ